MQLWPFYRASWLDEGIAAHDPAPGSLVIESLRLVVADLCMTTSMPYSLAEIRLHDD